MWIWLWIALCLVVPAVVVGVEPDHEYKALLEFDERVALAHSQYSTKATVATLVDLAVLYHLRDERWKQGGNWESLAYSDLCLQLIVSQAAFIRKKHRPLMYALYLHRARVLQTVGEFDVAVLTMDILLEQLKSERYTDRLPQLKSAALFTKGRALVAAGDTSAAAPLFVEAYSLNPCLHQAYYQLALCISHAKNTSWADLLLPQVQSLLSRVSLSQTEDRLVLESPADTKSAEGASLCTFDRDEDFFFELYKQGQLVHDDAALLTTQTSTQAHVVRSAFHWTLHLLYDLLNQPAPAWMHLQHARAEEEFRLYASPIKESAEAALMASRQITTFFQPGFWPLRTDQLVGSASTVPIFIVGYFRSGSTLLEQLLCVDSHIGGLGELSPFTFAMHPLQADLLDAVSADVSVQGEVSALPRLAAPLQRHADAIVQSMRQRLQGAELYANITSRPLPGGRANTSTDTTDPATQYAHLVDKMLLNFRNIALLHLVFPRALILHTVRDPLDTLVSCLRHRFGDFSACSLGMEAMVQDYAAYLEVMHHFRQVLPRLRLPALSAEARPVMTLRSALVDVRYEELVVSPQRVMARIFGLLGRSAPAPEHLRAFYQSERPVHTASFLQVKQPLYRRSVGHWRRYAAQVLGELAPLLHRELGRLRARGALPFAGSHRNAMNWDLRDDFDYDAMLEALAQDQP